MFSPFGLGALMYFLYGSVALISLYVILIYFLPFVQSLISNERIKWLEKYFETTPSSTTEEDLIRERLLNAAKPAQSHPIYKMLKFTLFTLGILGIIGGFVIMIIPEQHSGVGEKIINFVPLLTGVSIYLIYKNIYPGEGLWRELAGFFLLAGVASTALTSYELFELSGFFSSDIYMYIILSFGLFVVHHLNSVIASYVYIILVIFGASFVSADIGDNWMMFMKHFIWFFGLAILSFWLPRLREAKQIEMREILFGILFFVMILSLSTSINSGLSQLAICVMFPCLYLFSKIHFKKATWFGGKPIEIMVILAIVVGALILTQSNIVANQQAKIAIFSNFSFHKLVAFLIIVLAALIAFVMYSDQTDKDKKEINLYIVFGPIGAFLLVYIVGDNGSQYLINLFILVLGVMYLQNAILKKEVIQLILANMLIILAIAVRLYDFVEEFDNKVVVGFIVAFFGGLLLLLGVYIRKNWKVTSILKYETLKDVD